MTYIVKNENKQFMEYKKGTGKKMNIDNLIILNEAERPCMHCICRVMPNGKIIYINKYLRKRYLNLRKGHNWATIKDFGFVFKDNKFMLLNPSKVKYHDRDYYGKPRKWQGRKEFTYNDIINFDGRSRNE